MTELNLVPLKRLVRINERALPEDTDPGREFSYVDIGSVGRGFIMEEPPVMTFAQAPTRARRLVRRGDTIVSTVRTYLRAVWPIRESTDDFVVSTGFAVLSPGPDLDHRFLGWLAQSDVVVEEVVARSVGVSYPSVNASDIATIKVPHPSLPTQRAIADYLDAETTRIDALIAKKRSMAELLSEDLFAAVFAEVSGQSAKDRRDSGLAWVRELPVDWRTVPLRYFARLGTGHTPSRTHPEYWVDCTIPWISLFDVGVMRDPFSEMTLTTSQSISELGLAHSSAVLHPAGTVVLSRTASVGFATIMGEAMAVSQHFVTWTCGEHLLPEYLLYVLRAMRQVWESLQVGTTNVTVFMPDLLAVKVPLPPIAEQRRIVARIRRRAELIHSLMMSLRRQLDLLAEHRQALITAAVTGEIDVAKEAA